MKPVSIKDLPTLSVPSLKRKARLAGLSVRLTKSYAQILFRIMENMKDELSKKPQPSSWRV